MTTEVQTFIERVEAYEKDATAAPWVACSDGMTIRAADLPNGNRGRRIVATMPSYERTEADVAQDVDNIWCIAQFRNDLPTALRLLKEMSEENGRLREKIINLEVFGVEDPRKLTPEQLRETVWTNQEEPKQ